MADLYKTITGKSESQVREKMSRFLAFAMPVSTPQEAKAAIKEYQNAYHDARHVCWAYMLGPQRAQWQCNDNGEPSGTAGKPILGQINSYGLTNILIVVVRYFGGIKLGTSGLIAAYRAAAKGAIDNAQIVELHDMATLTARFPYLVMNDVMRAVKRSEAQIVGQEFDNSCELALIIRKDHLEALSQTLNDIDGTSIIIS